MPYIFRSEIRESEINQLLEKVEKENYGKYLRKLKMTELRGFKNATISFDFPVTALIGTNGAGKTTILGAAALIYKEIKPRRFFAKSGKFDNSMQDWKIEYNIVDREKSPQEAFTRTANYKSAKWSREALSRSVEVFGVSRTVPATERVELSRYASSSFYVEPNQIENIGITITQAVSKILGKDVTGYRKIRIDDKGRVTLLTGKTEGGLEYSEYHFGAGESSIIRMIMRIEALPENCLILIEEIENGLHPVATARMVEYLIKVASQKKAQTIFTTHSNDALKPLPNKAIWVASDSKTVYQGKLDIAALRAITGQVEAKLAIFTEDAFAKAWMESVIRTDTSIDPHSIEIHPMAGDGTAVSINRHHNLDPTRKFKSICYIDGDSRQIESDSENVFRLPGEGPESYIYDHIIDIIDSQKGLLSVNLQMPHEQQDRIESIVRSIRLTNLDEHTLFSQVSEHLGYLPLSTVQGAFLSVWCHSYPEEANRIRNIIKQYLDSENS